MIRNEDSLWKGLLEDTASDFIRFFHPDADETLDLDKDIQFLDKELEQVFPPENELFSSTVIDKLMKVFTKDKNEEWVLFHVEVQGKYTKEFGKRMHAYFYRLLDANKEMMLKKRKALFNFINFYIRFEFEETKVIFDRELHILTKNTQTMGVEEQILEMIKNEGIEKGREIERKEVKEKLVRKLIFNLGYTDQQIAEIIEVPINFVKKLRKQKVSLT